MKRKPSATSAAREPLATLRPLREGEAEAIARWYAKATVLAGSPVSLRDLLDSGSQVLVLTESRREEPAGLMALSMDDPEPGWATVALLAISREQLELVARAVALLEAAVRLAANHVRAAVPPDVGLALYFWLRLGYRPAVSGERLWMTSDLEA